MDRQNRRELIAAYKERKVCGGVFGIRNTVTGKILLLSTTDLQGCENRFRFSQMTGSCTYSKVQKDWAQYGGQAFCFELYEALEKKETQTDRQFREDIDTLYGLWLEKLQGQALY